MSRVNVDLFLLRFEIREPNTRSPPCVPFTDRPIRLSVATWFEISSTKKSKKENFLLLLRLLRKAVVTLQCAVVIPCAESQRPVMSQLGSPTLKTAVAHRVVVQCPWGGHHLSQDSWLVEYMLNLYATISWPWRPFLSALSYLAGLSRGSGAEKRKAGILPISPIQAQVTGLASFIRSSVIIKKSAGFK